MKITSVLSVFILFFLGCSSKNAFSELNISNNEQVAMENTKCGKIASDTEVDGIYTVIYVSKIYPNEFDKKRAFYISLFLKSDAKEPSVTLNGKKPLEFKELEANNKYAKLLSTNSLWTKHYLVVFEDDKEENFNLVIDSGQFSSGQLNYLRESL